VSDEALRGVPEVLPEGGAEGLLLPAAPAKLPRRKQAAAATAHEPSLQILTVSPFPAFPLSSRRN
jgi:hypothetical protein